MHLFLVIYDEAVASKYDKLAVPHSAIEGIYKVSDHVLLIQTPIDEAKHLGTFFGLDGEPNDDADVGVIFKLNGSYYGNYFSELWDWLRKAREEIKG